MARKVNTERDYMLHTFVQMEEKVEKYQKALMKDNGIDDLCEYEFTKEQEKLKRLLFAMEGVIGTMEETIESIFEYI